MPLVVVISLAILVYLTAGVLIIKGITMLGHEQPPDDILGVIVVFWPIVLLLFVAFGIWDIAKAFIRWDVETWQAARKTKRIERDLEKEK